TALNMLGGGILLCAGLAPLLAAGGAGLAGWVLAGTLAKAAFGLLEVGTCLLQIFGSDKAERAADKRERQGKLHFATSTHQRLGGESLIDKTSDWFQEHAEFVYGIVSIVSAAMLVVSGLAPGGQIGLAIAGAFYMAAYSLYTLFVKRERDCVEE